MATKSKLLKLARRAHVGDILIGRFGGDKSTVYQNDCGCEYFLQFPKNKKPSIKEIRELLEKKLKAKRFSVSDESVERNRICLCVQDETEQIHVLVCSPEDSFRGSRVIEIKTII